jgi:hypothetical protein
VPPDAPMDFAGCMEVFLVGAWHVFDPRNNSGRIGRIIIARDEISEVASAQMLTSDRRYEQVTRTA